jgi:ligand-binding SRPBCC domain-containing protein
MARYAMRIHTIDTEQLFPGPPASVFPFFADARNLERITPLWLSFKILTPGAIEMRAGTIIDYRIRLHGFPVLWRSEIAVWEAPFRFVDRQLRGPYRLWVHEHRFEERGGSTLVRDHVDYAVPGGEIIRRFLVARDLDRIFEYRRCELARIFRLGRPA